MRFTTVIFLLMLFNQSYCQKSDSIKPETLLEEKVTELLIANNVDGLLKMCNDEYRQRLRLELFEKKINLISKSFKENGIKDVDNLRKRTKNSKNLIEGEWIEKYSFNYTIQPRYIAPNIQLFIEKKVGYNIYVSLIKSASSWTIDKIEFNNSYFELDFNIDAYIKRFFDEGGTYNIRYSINEKQNQLNGEKVLKSQNMKIDSLFLDLIFVPESKILTKIKKKKSYLISISNEKCKNMSETDRIYEALLIPEKIYLDIVFYENSSHLLISNGYNYAIFFVNNKVNIENLQIFTNELLDNSH